MKMISLMALMVPVLAHAASTPTLDTADCDVDVRVTPRYDATPRRLDVELSFPAEGRTSTRLDVTEGWAGINDYGKAMSQWSGGEPRTTVEATDRPGHLLVIHAPQGRVHVSYQVRTSLENPDDGKPQQRADLYHVQVGADAFQFFGHGVLPGLDAWPEMRDGTMCLTLRQDPNHPGPLFGPNLGASTAADDAFPAEVLLKQKSPHIALRHAFYGGGPGWRIQTRMLAAQSKLRVAFRGQAVADEPAFADQAARLLRMQREFWREDGKSEQTIVLTPNYTPRNATGTLVRQASVLHVPQSAEAQQGIFDFLIGHENLHQWLPSRLGRMPAVRGADEVPYYWLSEGFTDYYTHRLLLASGVWRPERYAAELTKKLQAYWRSPDRNATAASIAPRFFTVPDAGQQMYARGEVLAMRWDAALLAAGETDGLDGLLRALMITASADATPAPERVLKTIGAKLGSDSPTQDVEVFVNQGRDLPLAADIAGPCFSLGWSDVPRWVPGFDWRAMSGPQPRIVGVTPDGPAWIAGLRDDQQVLAAKFSEGDLARDIEIRVQTAEGPRDIRFRPVDGTSDRLPQLTVNPAAAGGAPSTVPSPMTQEQLACHHWLRVMPPA